ncbi:hypothetical protein A0H76_1254 [Hepatospora eriocheir]|uniref:Uncharacterized protein n=1 Tax=Hepatospora eriocheir TaxID=1081669 RepID=A0A1X0Q5Y3_9MICR|nr:hypothetical protein A0H76_1254 [Hepatospora eriocheir]
MKLVFSREKFILIDDVLRGNKNLSKSIENSAKQAEKNKEEINKNRIDIKYDIGDLILIKNENCSKLDERFRGPFEVLEVYENSLKVINENSKEERVNIKRVSPFKKGEDVMVDVTYLKQNNFKRNINSKLSK